MLIICKLIAPYEHSIEPLNRIINTLGIPDNTMTTSIHAKYQHLRRDIDAIVFNGPTNEQRPDGVIHFPTDDDEIDLSGSFIPSNVNTNTQNPVETLAGTYANCGAFSQNGAASAGLANSGVFTFPNGTQVVYSKCEVVQHVVGG